MRLIAKAAVAESRVELGTPEARKRPPLTVGAIEPVKVRMIEKTKRVVQGIVDVRKRAIETHFRLLRVVK
jgi:hypothetical protein